jgi:predicted nucleic acid-binding protein
LILKLLDSVILIDHLNGIRAATDYLLMCNPDETAISVITRAEILVGVEEAGQSLVKAFLDQYHLLIIDKEIADLAAKLRRQFPWKLPDAFQGALSLHHRIKLITRNTKDFDPQQHAFVEIPYQR